MSQDMNSPTMRNVGGPGPIATKIAKLTILATVLGALVYYSLPLISDIGGGNKTSQPPTLTLACGGDKDYKSLPATVSIMVVKPGECTTPWVFRPRTAKSLWVSANGNILAQWGFEDGSETEWFEISPKIRKKFVAAPTAVRFKNAGEKDVKVLTEVFFR